MMARAKRIELNFDNRINDFFVFFSIFNGVFKRFYIETIQNFLEVSLGKLWEGVRNQKNLREGNETGR